MRIDRVFSALAISAQGMSAQRKRMDAIASNIADPRRSLLGLLLISAGSTAGTSWTVST